MGGTEYLDKIIAEYTTKIANQGRNCRCLLDYGTDLTELHEAVRCFADTLGTAVWLKAEKAARLAAEKEMITNREANND